MDTILTNESKRNYTYDSRYSVFPFFYNNQDNKYVYGLTGQLSLENDYIIHKVEPGDTLDNLALAYYGRPDYFWIIADFNRIKDSFAVLYNEYETLMIPNYKTVTFSEMV